MATVSGLGTTFSLPNYHGELFAIAPSDTPLLSIIGGGLGAGKRSNSVEFEWQTEGLEATSANNSKVEGATAPTASGVSRSNVSNVVEIHQEKVEVSYTKLAATGLFNGINADQGSNPVQDELSHQIMLKLKKIAVDVEKSFLLGTYSKPSNTSAARTTQGIIGAVTTNVFGNGGTPRAVTKSIVDVALGTMYNNGAPLNQDTTMFMVNPAQKIQLSNLYAALPLNQPTFTRNIGGVAIDTLVTDFGQFGVVKNRWIPPGKILIVDVDVLSPVFLDVPGKGSFFAEPLAKTGSSQPYQIYGEVGLEYGPELFHGVISDLNVGLGS